MVRTIFRGSRKARTQKCARTHCYAERSTANPEIPARNSVRNSKRRTFTPGFDSERLTRLCGTGVPFRPLFGPIPSCNVPGLKNSFQLRPRDTCGRPHRDSNYPDKQRSIRKKTCSVKLSSKQPCGNKCTGSTLAPPLHAQVVLPR